MSTTEPNVAACSGGNDDIIFLVLFTATIAFLSNTIVVQPIFARIASTIGDWSYGICMWHWPLLLALGGVHRIFLKAGTSTIDAAFQIIYFVLLFPIAALSYQFIELPAKHLIRRLTGAGGVRAKTSEKSG